MSAKVVERLIAIQLVGEYGNEEKIISSLAILNTYISLSFLVTIGLTLLVQNLLKIIE
jgi:hypothetical protein